MVPLAAYHVSLEEFLLCMLALFFTYWICRVGYRIFFHPIRHFPGPTCAAATTLYRAYYQIWRDGDHLAQATRLHEIYGPVVRVAPNTLHFRNPTAFHDIFSFSKTFTKDPDFYDHLGQSDALFGLVEEEIHRERFKLVRGLFSKSWAIQFELTMHHHTNRLCSLLLKSSMREKHVNIARGFRAVALDIMEDFVFSNIPDHLRGLRDETFDTLFVHTTFDVMDWTAWCFRNFPFALTLSTNCCPQWLRRIILPGEAANIDSFETIMALVACNVVAGPKWHSDSLLSRLASKVTLAQLVAECMGTLFGGVINIANMLPYGCFCVCESPGLQDALFKELSSIWEDPNTDIPNYSQLVELEILTGVVKESLRLMHGVIVGPPRVVPSAGATIDGYYVPPATVVTTSSYYVHMDPAIFPEPEKVKVPVQNFDLQSSIQCTINVPEMLRLGNGIQSRMFHPHRWKDSTSAMERSLVPFSNGRRMCPGKEISIMELYIVFAAVFRRFQIHISNTKKNDFDWKVYVSLHFKGRFFHANLFPREGYYPQKV